MSEVWVTAATGKKVRPSQERRTRFPRHYKNVWHQRPEPCAFYCCTKSHFFHRLTTDCGSDCREALTPFHALSLWRQKYVAVNVWACLEARGIDSERRYAEKYEMQRQFLNGKEFVILINPFALFLLFFFTSCLIVVEPIGGCSLFALQVDFSQIQRQGCCFFLILHFDQFSAFINQKWPNLTERASSI